MAVSNVYQGAADAGTATNDFKALAFLAEPLISRISTATLVWQTPVNADHD